MDFDQTITSEQAALGRRLLRMVGSRELAEDLAQETVIRTWEHGPRAADAEQVRAWMHRVASNLAVDAIRCARRRAPALELDETWATDPAADPDDSIAVREALDGLAPHQRMLLLLRFQAGLTHREIAELLDISQDAARQRLSRARRVFSDVYRGAAVGRQPRVYVLYGEHPPGPYLEWLQEAGADARVVRRQSLERDLATADGLVVAGGESDIDPRVYGQARRGALVEPDIDRDLQDLVAIKTALEQDIPLVGVCRGHQLLNILFGGTLHQDLKADRVADDHGDQHPITTARSTLARRIFGTRSGATSRHHQAVSRVGRGLRAVAASDDGVNEAVEVPRRRFAIGVQFHPEERQSDGDRRLAYALVDAARAA